MSDRRSAPALLLCVAALTFFAVFAYGLASVESERWFDIGVAGLFAFWLCSLGTCRRVPNLPMSPTITMAALLMIGWTSVINAQFTHEWANGFARRDHLEWLFGSVDREKSLEKMIHLSAMFAGSLVVLDLANSRRNRRSILKMVALVGLAVALVGLWQKASGSDYMLFFDEPLPLHRFFAAYRYHGNAATLLNFAWPIAAVLLLRSIVRHEGGVRVALWGSASLFTLAAVFVNTSKMGHLLGAGMILAMIIAYRRTIGRILRRRPGGKIVAMVTAVLLIGLIGFLVQLSFSTSMERWEDLDGSLEPRLATYRTALDMIPSSGWLGTGPGTFSTVYPYHVSAEGRQLDFFWHTAHQDYLQTLIEWGWLGAVLWGALLVQVCFAGWKRARSGDHFYTWAVLIGVTSALVQALGDFPAQIGSLQWIGMLLGCNLVFRYESRNNLK